MFRLRLKAVIAIFKGASFVVAKKIDLGLNNAMLNVSDHSIIYGITFHPPSDIKYMVSGQ